MNQALNNLIASNDIIASLSFVAYLSSRALIFAVIGHNTITIPETF